MGRKAGVGGERRESYRAFCPSAPTPHTLVALPPPLSAWRPYLQVGCVKLGSWGPGEEKQREE